MDHSDTAASDKAANGAPGKAGDKPGVWERGEGPLGRAQARKDLDTPGSKETPQPPSAPETSMPDTVLGPGKPVSVTPSHTGECPGEDGQRGVAHKLPPAA